MTKEDITTFHDHGEFISINFTPYYTANHVCKALLHGVFLGLIFGIPLGMLTFKMIF